MTRQNMDPDANLNEQRVLAAALLARDYDRSEEPLRDFLHDVITFVVLSQALDVWLAHGGELPEAWQGVTRA